MDSAVSLVKFGVPLPFKYGCVQQTLRKKIKQMRSAAAANDIAAELLSLSICDGGEGCVSLKTLCGAQTTRRTYSKG